MNKVELFLKDNELKNLKKIVTELYDSNSIRSDNLEEFLKFTIHIILSEWNSDNRSLYKFYKQNEKLYKNF
ncbi:MAG TPA: hypothetical protein VN704_06320 [Verrucomicrobiae bacterium]|nr:hypothetical protein [Verrucomicrobiae bacterium]